MVAIYNSCNRTTRKEIREKTKEGRILKEKLQIKTLCKILLNAYNIISATTKNSPKCKRPIISAGKDKPCIPYKSHTKIRDKIERFMFSNLPDRVYSKLWKAQK